MRKKKFVVKTSFIEKTYVEGVYWNFTENKENYFEIDAHQIPGYFLCLF